MGAVDGMLLPAMTRQENRRPSFRPAGRLGQPGLGGEHKYIYIRTTPLATPKNRHASSDPSRRNSNASLVAGTPGLRTWYIWSATCRTIARHGVHGYIVAGSCQI